MQNSTLWRYAKYAVLVLIAGTAIFGAFMFGVKATPKNIDKDNKATAQVIQSVTAEVRPIASVLILEASVVANPMFRMTAPIDGMVVRSSDGRIGIQAAKNKTVQPIELPPSSKVVNLLVPPGATVTAGLPIVNVSYVGFALQALVPPEKIYRLYGGIISARGEITNGPGPFDATILGIPFVPGSGGSTESMSTVAQNESTTAIAQVDSTGTANQSGASGLGEVGSAQVGDGTQGVIVVAATPTDLKLLEGLPGLLALKTAEETGVVLPIEAVAGISQRGQVYVDQKGKCVLRDITIGITDGSHVQIKSGLSAGEKVLLPSPSIVNLK